MKQNIVYVVEELQLIEKGTNNSVKLTTLSKESHYYNSKEEAIEHLEKKYALMQKHIRKHGGLLKNVKCPYLKDNYIYRGIVGKKLAWHAVPKICKWN